MNRLPRAGRRRLFALAVLLGVLAFGGPMAVASGPLPVTNAVARGAVAKRPHYPVLVVGHRGAPGYLPEHTIAGYRKAIEQGADYIEPDLVPTRDGVLIARHESDLTRTTDVLQHPELGGRTRAEQLTIDEVRTLRAGGYRIPTLAEILDLLRYESRGVGVYVELKSAAHFRAIGLHPEETLAATLTGTRWADADAPLYVSSFEPDSLRHLKTLLPLTKLSLNLGGPVPPGPAQLDDVATYATTISVNRDLLAPGNPSGPALMEAATARGLAVHAWTFGVDNPYGPLPPGLGHPSDPPAWAEAAQVYRAFYELGVRAVFSDTPDIAVWARG